MAPNLISSADSATDYPLLFSPAPVEPPHDSLKPYLFDEIVVNALRFKPPLSNSPSAVSFVDRAQIERGTATALSSVVSGVSGLFVKDYGSMSGLKTVSQRGLGAEHTLVLLNGIRISSFQNGLLDFGLFPASEIERVEILHGGNSAAYGPDAVGGVIDILTRSQTQSSSLDLESSFGSFGYQRYRVSGGMASTEIGFRASLLDERSVEDFDFLFHNGPAEETLLRNNADFSSRYGTLQSFFPLGKNTRVDLFAQTYASARGVAGPVVSPTSSSQARQMDRDHLIQLAVN